MVLIRYSCNRILGPHEPIPTKFWLWMFFHAQPIHGIQNAEMQKKVFCDVIASVLHSFYQVSRPNLGLFISYESLG